MSCRRSLELCWCVSSFTSFDLVGQGRHRFDCLRPRSSRDWRCLSGSRHPQRKLVHVECRALRGKRRLRTFTRPQFQSIERKCQAMENKGTTQCGVCLSSHALLIRKKTRSVVTSDTFDVCGPIPLTFAGMQMRPL